MTQEQDIRKGSDIRQKNSGRLRDFICIILELRKLFNLKKTKIKQNRNVKKIQW